MAWEGVASLLATIGLMALLVIGSQWLQRWNAADEDRRLPALSVPQQDIPKLAREAFEVICRSSSGPNQPVNMSQYFKAQRWNERDIRCIFDPISPVLVKQHGLFTRTYMPTERGLDVYGRIVMSESAERVNIWASEGSFVGGINIKSSGATAQAGSLNSAFTQVSIYQRVAESLRADAENANTLEADVACNYADDLTEAIGAQDQSRIDQVLGRINGLITTATSAFSLTREVTNLLG
ncbi:hypothetical protein OG428_22975 [Streptomyces sp. NBC_01422]